MPHLQYSVRVTKDTLVFSAGHFITYNGDHCERIHGHNYRVAVEVEADLDGNLYVFDFIALWDQTQSVVNESDHRMLLPRHSLLIRIEDDGTDVTAHYKDRRWSFPRDECVLLPVANTTAEMLANYIAARLRDTWTSLNWPMPAIQRVEVEECFGQSASVEWKPS